MELTDALCANPAIREFTDDVVDDATLHDLLDVARFAPSGGNRQPWRVIVVKDPDLRRRLGALCRPVWNEYVAQMMAGETPFSVVTPTAVDLAAAAAEDQPNPMLEHLADAPAVLVVAVDLGSLAMMDKDLDRPALTGGGSVYPFAYSILLAARDRGLGGVMTTFLARAEQQARPLLGLPEHWAVATMIVLGRPARRPTKLSRRAVRSFATVDRADGEPFGD